MRDPYYTSLYQTGDLVRFVGYHYSPDYKYIDEDDYSLGVVVEICGRHIYEPIIRVYWFKKGYTTEVMQQHLSLVVKEKQD